MEQKHSTLENTLAVAKKYYLWSFPMMEPAIGSEFARIINWDPRFDGKRKDEKTAALLSYDVMIMGTHGGASNAAAAMACAVFDIAYDDVCAAQNLGCAIATFCDNSKNEEIKDKEKEIYADAESVLLYAVNISLDNGKYTHRSLDPLTALGNLYLDMARNEEAKDKFEAALNIRDSYPPAMAGLMAYYRAVNRPQMMRGFGMAAKNKPTVIGRAFNEIIKNNDDKVPSRKEPLGTEEALEKNMEELSNVEATTYADIFGEIDPENAGRIRKNAKAISDKMKIKVPDMTVLTQFTKIDEENQVSIRCACKAVEEELLKIIDYTRLYSLNSISTQADVLENLGVSGRMMGMTLPDFMRDAAKNPKKYENAEISVDPGLAGHMQSRMMAFADDMLANMNKIMSGDMSSDNVSKVFKGVGKVDPLTAVLGLDPYDYANSWDVIIQQFNAKRLSEKINAIGSYITMVNGRTSQGYADIVQTFWREYNKIATAYAKEEERINDAYRDDPDKLKVHMHKLHVNYFPQFNNCFIPYFGQATQLTSMAYKKLERYIPMMYQAAMRHLVYISDEKVRQDQENKLVGMIAQGLQAAIQILVASYGFGGVRDIRQCGCDEEELKRIERSIAEREKKLGNEMITAQKAKMNAFKNGDVDQNSSWYKDYIKKYEYSLDLIFIKYRTNDHFTVMEKNFWTPFGSFEHSKFENHISGKTSVNCDISLGLDAGAVKGEAKFGFSYVKDKDGRIHPDDLDIRSGLDASVGKGPLSASAGISASLQRGTKLHSKLELTGNEYIDGLKTKYFGERGGWIRTEVPTLELWSGEYEITDKN
jgi:tetratricopeptide (TPR) repeat protein